MQRVDETTVLGFDEPHTGHNLLAADIPSVIEVVLETCYSPDGQINLGVLVSNLALMDTKASHALSGLSATQQF